MTSGLNHAVVEGLPSAADMRTYEQQARLATIADPRLRQEVSDFFIKKGAGGIIYWPICDPPIQLSKQYKAKELLCIGV